VFDPDGVVLPALVMLGAAQVASRKILDVPTLKLAPALALMQ
jgi:hypothetical protein